MSADPIRQAVAAKQGIVRYTLPPLFAPEAEQAVDVATLTAGAAPPHQAETGSDAFDRFLHDYRAGAYGT